MKRDPEAVGSSSRRGEPMGIAMLAIDRFLLLIRALHRSERGMALPTAMLATVASLGLAGTAVMSSVNVQQGSHRDSDSKNAIAAADAGASIALLRLNRYASALSPTSPCLAVNKGSLALSPAALDGWCPAISGTVGDSSYIYRATPASATAMSVVATGTSGEVSRRIAVTYKTTTVGSALGKEGMIGVDKLQIDNNADVEVGVGTNGNVTVGNNANVCGNIRKGVGKEHDTDKATQCTGYGISEGNVSLPPVSSFMPTTIATSNSNWRLVACTSPNIPAGCQADTYTGNWKSSPPWASGPRTISLPNNTTLTLGGGDYWVCRLYIKNNSHLVMDADAKVRIFFDTPEKCGIKAGEKQIDINNGSDITATGYQPELGKFDVPGLYVTGSETIPTTIEMSNNSNKKEVEGGNEFILYAPNSNIIIKNNAVYTGVIAGKTVHFEKGILRQDPGFKPPEIGGATIFERQSYVECTGATATPPNARC